MRRLPVVIEAVSMRWFWLDIRFNPKEIQRIVHIAKGNLRYPPTQTLCTLVSVAFLLSLLLFGFPGTPYITAQLIELVSLICSRRS